MNIKKIKILGPLSKARWHGAFIARKSQPLIGSKGNHKKKCLLEAWVVVAGGNLLVGLKPSDAR